MDRRTFLQVAGFLAMAGSRLAASSAKPQKFKMGFAPATDGTTDMYWKTVEGCSKVGFRHMEVDNTIVKIAETYNPKISEFKDRMAKAGVQLVGINQSFRFTDPAQESAIREKIGEVGKFLSAAGATYFGWEGTLSSKEGGAPGLYQEPEEEEIRRVARLANEQARRIKEQFGLRFTYHTHSTIGFRRLMDLTNPAYLSLNPDLGWLKARGNADALEVLRAYRSRVMTIHFKDFDPNKEYDERGRHQKGGHVIVGRGVVDFPAVVDFLKESDFDGFVLGEHIGLSQYDYVRKPESVEAYGEFKKYFVEKLGLNV